MKSATKSQHGDDRCYCGHTRANHNIEGMCPLSAIAYQYARFPGDNYCKCEGFIVEQPPAPRAGERDEEWLARPDYKGQWEVIAKQRDGSLRQIVGRLGFYEPEEENARRVATDYNQHATLVEQRDRAVTALKRMLSVFAPYANPDTEQWREEVEAYDEAQTVLATIEQEGEVR